jgi:hypothetical protein
MRVNLRTSVLVGFIMATCYAIYAVVVYAVRGPAPFAAHGVSLQIVLLTYYAAGILGGLVVGVMLPVARNSVGALLVGVVIGLIVFFCIEVASSGPVWKWTSDAWEDVLVLGALLGAPGGWVMRKIWS